jgi:iron(III) transport system permease protein
VNVGVFVITTKIYTLVNRFPPDYALASAMGLALAAITGFAVSLYGKAVAARTYTTITGKGFRPRRMNMGAWTPLLFGLCLVYILVAVILPLGILVYTSFLVTPTTDLQEIRWTLANYEFAFIKLPIVRVALQTSFVLGVLTATIGVVYMGLIAWIMYRSKMRGARLLEYVSMFPQAVPGLVFSLGLLWAWLAVPIGIYGTIWILLLCYLTVFLPIGVRTMSGVVLQLDASLEECARVCGASWLKTLWTVTLPLLRPGVVATWMLLFIVSLREVSSSVLLMSAGTKVIGPTLLNFYETALPPVAAVAVVMAAVIFAAMILARLASNWIVRKTL